MALDRVNISADRYRWAIQRAGLTVDGYMESHPNIALSEWMDDTKQPTIKQLEAFAKSVNVPFGYLFLETVPVENVPFPMFRGEAGRFDHFDLNVYDTVNIVRQRQEWLEEYLQENGIEACSLVGSVNLGTPINETVRRLREALDLEPRWAFSLASSATAVGKLTEMLEFAGVFVCYNGVVGNNAYRKLNVDECRGFALSNEYAPYIFVNSQDAKSAQLFTLIHEAAHLMLGVSAGHATIDSVCHEAEETYCDAVAAEFLVPASVLREVWNGDIKAVARRFKVSEIVVARRAHNLGKLSDDDYRAFWAEYSSRPVTSKRDSSGGSFYMTSVKRVGRLFAIHVKNAVNSRQLSYTQAYRLTGLQGRTYDQFMNNNI